MIGSSSRQGIEEIAGFKRSFSWWWLVLVAAAGLMSVDAASRDSELVLRLYLVRHGETQSNVEVRVSGQAESVCAVFVRNYP